MSHHITTRRTPRYDAHGVLLGHTETTYSPLPQAARQAPQLVTLSALTTLVQTELARRNRAWEAKLAAYSQQAAEQAERTSLGAQLAAHGWTEQDCTSMPLPALRRLAEHVAQGQEDQLPSDAPAW